MQSLTMDNIIHFASPQKENGYTPFANELFEQIISFEFTKRQLLVVMAIARMTYGYNRKTDALSTVQIANLLKMNRPDVSKTLNELVEINVIIKHQEGRKSHGVFVHELSINKNYLEWITDSKSPTDSESLQVVKNEITGSKSHTQRVVNHPTHKAIKTTKTSIAKNTKKTSLPNDFAISERVTKWANEKGFKNLEQHLENFIFSCEKNNYQYSNWDSAFMDAIRKDWAKVNHILPANKNNGLNGMDFI